MPDNAPLRTLIVDDEPLAIERMQILCAEQEGITLVGTAADGAAALRMIESLGPDLVLLDIAMPELDGMAVAKTLGRQSGSSSPAIIFVTAFDSFAIEAFDLAAVDYLLKPVSADRLRRAVDRVAERRRIPSAEVSAPEPVDEFWVPHRSELVRIAANDIERIDAEREIACKRGAPRHVADMRVEAAIFVNHHEGRAFGRALRGDEIACQSGIRARHGEGRIIGEARIIRFHGLGAGVIILENGQQGCRRRRGAGEAGQPLHEGTAIHAAMGEAVVKLDDRTVDFRHGSLVR